MVGKIVLMGVALTLGCQTDPQTGEKEFTRESCEELEKAFELAGQGCAAVPDHADEADVERNRRYCRAASGLVDIAFDLGCPFAKEVDRNG